MKRVLLSLAAVFLLTTVLSAADKSMIKNNVDAVVTALEQGKAVTSYPADAYTPYVLIMDAEGKLLVHPHLAGEYLPEKAPPIFKALQQATPQGIWVQYLWKGAQKNSYVRRTKTNMIVGSGY
jgi:hypothetical protein